MGDDRRPLSLGRDAHTKLADPLIELAPSFATSIAPGASVVLAGLLDTQAEAVLAAYEAQGMTVVERGDGEWCVLAMQAPNN